MSAARTGSVFLLSVLALAVGNTARADKWAPPQESQVVSTAGTARATITPRGLSSPLAYYTGAGAGKAKPGQAAGAADHASAKVERRDADGTWRTLWQGPLRNDVAPVAALVTDDGTRLVTFDNWHAMGYGDEVLVIYDATGNVVRQYSLAQLLPGAYLLRLRHSVSSIWWRGDTPAIVDGGRTLRIDVAVPDADFDAIETVPLLVDLVDGAVLAEQAPEWKAALRRLKKDPIR